MAMQRSEAERALLATYDVRRVLTDLAAGDKHCAMFRRKGGELGDEGEGKHTPRRVLLSVAGARRSVWYAPEKCIHDYVNTDEYRTHISIMNRIVGERIRS